MTKRTLHHISLAFKLIGLLSLTSCAASGTMVNKEQMSSFTPGRTSYEQVVASLGTPTTITEKSNGSRIATYTRESVATRPESFIPFVGPFVGGADSTAHTVSLNFDRSGMLTTTDTQDTSIASTPFSR